MGRLTGVADCVENLDISASYCELLTGVHLILFELVGGIEHQPRFGLPPANCESLACWGQFFFACFRVNKSALIFKGKMAGLGGYRECWVCG